ncbi:MAG: glycosyltransferase family 2 protein, partial [Clostridia bacterium]|nr:glycosyltransferase family 2 protein [Clostridia bacterium]
YKLVDSDDWLDEDALKPLLATLRGHVAEGRTADLYITNFVYEKVTDNSRYVSRYTRTLPVNRFFEWKDTRSLKLWKMYLMHSLVYRTQLLRDVGVKLPEHTFYVDNIFAYEPLPYVGKLYYLDIDLYRYYIGRSDQSVTVDNVVKRYDQQINITRIMLRAHSYGEIESMCKPLRRQMYHCLHVMLMNTYFFTTAKDEPERRQLFALMWAELKENDPKLYRRLKRMPLVWILDRLRWKVKGRVTTSSYRFLCKYVKLGV